MLLKELFMIISKLLLA